MKLYNFGLARGGARLGTEYDDQTEAAFAMIADVAREAWTTDHRDDRRGGGVIAVIAMIAVIAVIAMIAMIAGSPQSAK